MGDAHDAPEAEMNNATATSSYNEPPDLPAGQAAHNSPVGPTLGDSYCPLIMIAAV